MSTDFSSIDRLVEFGMGISLAKQMVDTMNHTMSTMNTPGVNTAFTGQTNVCPQSAASQWYAAIDGRQAGPLSEPELTEMIKRDLIASNTLLWHPGMTAWKLAADIPEVNKLLILNR